MNQPKALTRSTFLPKRGLKRDSQIGKLVPVENIGTNISLAMGQFTKENGLVKNEMAKAYKLGVTAHNTQGNGKTTRLSGLASLYMPPETSTKVSGKIIRLMGLESTTISMVPSIRVSGSMICNMVSDEKPGQTTQFIMVTTIWVKNMELANMNGATDPNLLENGQKISFLESVNISGWTADLMKVIGTTIICKEQEFISGLMVESSLVNIQETKNTVMASTRAKTPENIWDTG